MKTENLTAEEKQELDNFIIKSVMNNAAFPSEKIGVDRVTIQQLLNEFSIEWLINFGDFIERKLTANGSSFKSRKGVLKFAGIPASELVTALHNIIKYKEYTEEKEQKDNRIKTLKNLLEDLKTPEERRKDIEAEIASLA